jgi:hypothetical protein
MPPKGKVIRHYDDDDEDDAQLFHAVRSDSKGTKRVASTTSTISRAASHLSNQSSQRSNPSNNTGDAKHSGNNDNISRLNSQNSQSTEIICLDDDDDIVPATSTTNALGGKRKRQEELIIDELETSNDDLKHDETYQKLLELRKRVKQVKDKPSASETAIPSSSPTLKKASLSSAAESTVVIPKVLTAAERKQRVEQQFAEEQLRQQQPNSKSRPNTNDLESDEDDDAISIKIRLATVNDESKWEFNPDKPISKVTIADKVANLKSVSDLLNQFIFFAFPFHNFIYSSFQE